MVRYLSEGLLLAPGLLAFAASSMMYPAVEEIIPEARLGGHAGAGTMGVMQGFFLLMIDPHI